MLTDLADFTGSFGKLSETCEHATRPQLTAQMQDTKASLSGLTAYKDFAKSVA